MNIAIILIIIGLLVAPLTIGLVFFLILKYNKKTSENMIQFVHQRGYKYDKGFLYKGRGDKTRELVHKWKVLEGPEHPYIAKYAKFEHYPFSRGVNKGVFDIIEGDYNGTKFISYKYHFTGTFEENTGLGGFFKVVMIPRNLAPAQMPEGVFYENGVLCYCHLGDRNVTEIEPIVDMLLSLK